MKEISVIGATSLLGINLVSLLAENGYKIYASYRSESRVPNSWRKNPSIVLQKLDLSKQTDFARFCRETIVWLAHLEQGRFNERETEVNLKPFENFLHQTQNSLTEKFVFVSSGGSVYGEPLFLPITEEHPRNPLSSYGKTKRAMEDALSEFGQTHNLKTVIIRPGNIYGFENPHRESKGIIGAFLNSIRTNTPFTLIHKGQTVRDFVHVEDVSRAILSAIERNQQQITWNVSGGKGYSIAEIIKLILEKSGFENPPINHIENFSSDVSRNILSIDCITSESNWLPLINIEDGISKTIENWLKFENSLSKII
ncbi:MAG: NAD-dependent epimerase/dehydratase family protein [Actinomycetota bacterium]